jgi:hypothetical protein
MLTEKPPHTTPDRSIRPRSATPAAAAGRYDTLRAMRARDRRRRRLYPLLAACALVVLLPAVVGGGGGHGAARLAPRAAAAETAVDPLTYTPSRRVALEQRAAAGEAHALYARAPGGVVLTARRVAQVRPLVERTARDAGLDPDTLEAVVFVEAAERRLDPRTGVAAAARYLASARDRLGSEDLAVASYRIGIDTLQRALDAYGADAAIPYAQLFFDSSPLRHKEAWDVLAGAGNDAATYAWRVGTARGIMAAWRADPGALARTADLQDNKASGEEVLHPAQRTERFLDPVDLSRARAAGKVVALPPEVLSAHGLRIDEHMGELAPALDQVPALYRALRPEALALAAYLGSAVQTLSGGGEITLTSTVRDERYQRLLASRNAEATHKFSMHTTGWAFDVLRSWETPVQSTAFQFVIDRLTALNLVAYLNEAGAIHVAVGPRAKELLPLLGRGARAAAGAGAP